MTLEKAQDIVGPALFGAMCLILVSAAVFGIAQIWLGHEATNAVALLYGKCLFTFLIAVALPAAAFICWPRYP